MAKNYNVNCKLPYTMNMIKFYKISFPCRYQAVTISLRLDVSCDKQK